MGNVTLYILDTSLFDIDEMNNCLSLSFDEQQFINKTTSEEKKKERLASLYLKHKYIGPYFCDINNKPLSDNIWFNISHSHNLVILATSSLPVGVDIEHIKPVSDHMKKYISSLEEYQYITDDQSFYELWTNKESLVKCIGTGIKGKVDEIIGLPINGIRIVNNILYSSKTIKYKNSIISITLENIKDIDIKMIEITNIN